MTMVTMKMMRTTSLRSGAVSMARYCCSGTGFDLVNPNSRSSFDDTVALVDEFCKSVPHIPNIASNIALTRDRAVSLFDRLLLSSSNSSGNVPFTKLLKVVSEIECHSQVVHLHRRLDLSQVPPTRDSLLGLIYSFSRLEHYRRFDFGLSVVGRMLKLGLDFTPGFNTVLNGLCSTRRIDLAIPLFHNSGFHHNRITCNILIKGFCKIRDIDSAINMLRAMELDNCMPDAVTYTTIIAALYRAGRLSWALGFFEEMISMGIPPTRVTYACLIRAACYLGQWDRVGRLFREMEAGGITPATETYNVLVRSFCRRGMVEVAMSVVAVMLKNDVEPDVITYSMLMLVSELDGALRLFRAMGARGCLPNVAIYTILIDKYAEVKRVDEAMKLYGEMVDNGIEPDTYVYCSLLRMTPMPHRLIYLDKIMLLEGSTPEEIARRRTVRVTLSFMGMLKFPLSRNHLHALLEEEGGKKPIIHLKMLMWRPRKLHLASPTHKSVCIRFVRLNGVLFTRTSLETFAEVLSLVSSAFCELLSSGPVEELNFGADTIENGLVTVRIIAILIFTVHKESEGQTHAEIVQRAVLLQNAYSTAFEVMGHILERCVQLRDRQDISYLAFWYSGSGWLVVPTQNVKISCNLVQITVPISKQNASLA